MTYNERKRNWRKANPDKVREIERRYRESHREKVRQKNRRWAKNHPDLKKARDLLYREEHRGELKESCRRHYKAHQEQRRETSRFYQKTHREQVNERHRLWLAEHPGKDREYGKKWRASHPEQNRERDRNYRSKHPDLMLLRHIVQRMMKESYMSKVYRSRQYVGCAPGFLHNHIEEQFKLGMTWENYGTAWHVDHIVPLSWFPFDKDPSLLVVASHWTNLQPLWGRENMVKGNRRAA